MALLSFLFNNKPKSASAAKERLQIIIARERSGRGGHDFLPALHKELIAVISKYAKVNPRTSSCRWIARAIWKFWMSTWCCPIQNLAVSQS